MNHIRLIHWNAAEGEEKAKLLKTAGYRVDHEVLNPAAVRQLKAHPPQAIIIDLTRLPSQGRDIALHLRQFKSTRGVPQIFVEGDREKVERIKQLLPDAVYTTWERIETDIKDAIAHPPADPVVPESIFAGYSGTQLAKKLGIKANVAVALVDPPANFKKTLGDLPEGVKLQTEVQKDSYLIIWFTRSRKELQGRIDRMVPRINAGGMWIVWPKKTSRVASDLTQAEVRRIGLATGLVDYKVCAVDQTWSGLKFTRRKSK
jgi:hypothetical protein